MATDLGTNASAVNEAPPISAAVDEPAKDEAPQSEESRRLCAYWKDQLKQVKDEYKRFEKRGRMIEKRYRDERNRVDEDGQRRYNALWSNVQVLQPALYGRAPVPVAERRFRDRDPVGRNAASMLERGLRNEVEVNGLNEALELAVLDYLLPGRGVVWVRYEPEFEEGTSVPTEGEMEMRDARGPIEPDDDSETEIKLRETGDRVVRETAPVDYVPWSDFFTFPAKARTWREVTAVGKRVYMTREQMVRRFGAAGKKVPLEKDDRERRRQNESVIPDEDADHKGQCYEIWHRGDERAYWLAEGYDQLLDRRDDPLQLEDFFPVPRPLYANPTTNTLVPVPDYIQYQDQAIQLDELTQRISMLSKACKVAGVYNSQAKDIQRLLDESVENELIPVDSWAAFAGEKGGVAGQISLLPLKEIMGVLNELVAVREKVLADMDRLTGLSDVMRGTTDERETMGGTRLKTNNAGTRLSKRQADVARFCRDTVRIISQIMCIHFSPKSLVEASGALYEEGLGDVDPEILNGPQQPPQPPGVGPPGQGTGGAGSAATVPSLTPAAPGPSPQPPMHPGMAPSPGMQGGPPSAISASAPPTSQPGTNVVPFKPPGMSAPMQLPMGMGMPQPPQVPPEVLAKIQALQRISKAIELLRNEKLRGFRVDIEVDSTVFGDAAQEKQDRTEFLDMATKYIQTAMQLGAMEPKLVPLLGKFLQFGVRGFRVGRDLESAIEDFVDEMEQQAKAKAGQPPPPNPEQIKAQTEIMKAQTGLEQTKLKIGADQQKNQASVQADQVKAQGDQQKNAAVVQQTAMKGQVDQQRLTAEMQQQQIEAHTEQQKSAAELQSHAMEMRMREMELKIQEMQMHADIAKAKAQVEAAKMPAVPKDVA